MNWNNHEVVLVTQSLFSSDSLVVIAVVVTNKFSDLNREQQD